jgi:hypothetical protein
MQATCSLPHHVSLQQILTATTQAQKAPSLAFLDQDADRIGAKSNRAFQMELSETLTPLPDVPDPGTLVAAVPVQRDRRSMSRRPGQNGCSAGIRFRFCSTRTFLARRNDSEYAAP